jgi:hypothetical protein
MPALYKINIIINMFTPAPTHKTDSNTCLVRMCLRGQIPPPSRPTYFGFCSCFRPDRHIYPPDLGQVWVVPDTCRASARSAHVNPGHLSYSHFFFHYPHHGRAGPPLNLVADAASPPLPRLWPPLLFLRASDPIVGRRPRAEPAAASRASDRRLPTCIRSQPPRASARPAPCRLQMERSPGGRRLGRQSKGLGRRANVVLHLPVSCTCPAPSPSSAAVD